MNERPADDHAPAHGHAPAHDHGHAHGHGHGHGHALGPEADARWLTLALALIAGFMLVEVVAGLRAHSVALLSDAAHMLTDAAAVLLALIAMRLAARPAQGPFTFGLRRVELLSAQANGATLLVLAGWLGYETVRRLIAPPEVHGGLVVLTAAAGVVVNLAATAALARADRTSLNIEGAYQHVLTDLFAFIATLVAGAVVYVTGFSRADALASALVVALMLVSGVRLVRQAGRVLLDAAPEGVDVDRLGAELAGRDHVVEIHDLHLWEIAGGQIALSAHVIVREHGDCHRVRQDLEQCVLTGYRITHTTLQVDHETGGAQAPGQAHCVEPHGPVHRLG